MPTNILLAKCLKSTFNSLLFHSKNFMYMKRIAIFAALLMLGSITAFADTGPRVDIEKKVSVVALPAVCPSVVVDIAALHQFPAMTEAPAAQVMIAPEEKNVFVVQPSKTVVPAPANWRIRQDNPTASTDFKPVNEPLPDLVYCEHNRLPQKS